MTPESNQKHIKRPWSRGVKKWLVVYSIAAALALSWFFRQRAVNTLPPMAPPHPMPAVNARDYYIAAADALKDKGKILYASQTPPPPPAKLPANIPARSKLPADFHDTWEKKSADDHVYSLPEKVQIVADNTEALQLLHQGFQYPYQEPPARRFSTDIPLYVNARYLDWLLRIQAETEAKRGHWKQCLDVNLDATQLGETLTHGGTVGQMYLGLRGQSNGRKYAWAAVSHLSGPEARAAARRLESIRTAHMPFTDTMQEEKWSMQAGLRDVMAKQDWANQLFLKTDRDSPRLLEYPKEWIIRQAGVSYVETLGKKKILLNNSHWMDIVIAQAQQPYAAHPTLPVLPADLINPALLYDFRPGHFTEVKADTQNALLVTALALQAYRQGHKAYPATLTALVPVYLKAVPVDPFALFGPLGYKRIGAKYVLYSVGPDSRDDGGKAIFDTRESAPGPRSTSDRRRWTQEDSTGDVVAGVNTN